MGPLPPELRADIARVGRLSSVPDVLTVLTRLTGMGFAAVARVTDTRWITCQVRDDLAFGLAPGDERRWSPPSATACAPRATRCGSAMPPSTRSSATTPRRGCTASKAMSRCRSSSTMAACSAPCVRWTRCRASWTHRWWKRSNCWRNCWQRRSRPNNAPKRARRNRCARAANWGVSALRPGYAKSSSASLATTCATRCSPCMRWWTCWRSTRSTSARVARSGRCSAACGAWKS